MQIDFSKKKVNKMKIKEYELYKADISKIRNNIKKLEKLINENKEALKTLETALINEKPNEGKMEKSNDEELNELFLMFCKEFNCDHNLVNSESRKIEYVNFRYIFIKALRISKLYTYSRIAKFLNNRNHATIIHQVENTWRANDKELNTKAIHFYKKFLDTKHK